jgi:hypothetical protein
MELINIKLTFQDTFSFSKCEKICFKTVDEFNSIKNEIGKIVHKEQNNGCTFLWKLISVEEYKFNNL